MDAITLTSQLVREGYDHAKIRRLRRRGDLRLVRRGANAQRTTAESETSPVGAHRQLIEATVPQLRADAVVSHVSAAVLHGLPVWPSDLSAVHITRPRIAGGGKHRSLVRLHSSALTSPEVTEIDGMPVTSLARTVFDLARAFPYERAVAAGDKALALGLALEELAEMIDRGRAWAGIGQARRVSCFIDGRSESAGESVSRVRIAELGLPPPELQLQIRLPDGRTAFTDFSWPEFGTIGEFDGVVKYQGLLRPGETAADAVLREKRREDQLRALGWQIVRWLWADLARFGLVRDQLLAAFARGHRIV